jgi:hypothetical protein
MLQEEYKLFAEGLPVSELRTLDQICRELGIDIKRLAEKAGLDANRVLAIVGGRWTPSPQERDRIAAAVGLTREQIAWGHKAMVDHMYGHGPQFGRSP